MSRRAYSLRPEGVALILFLFLFLVPGLAEAQAKPVPRVLVPDDLGIISSPGFAEVDPALFAGLLKSPFQIEPYEENLELPLFYDEPSYRHIRDQFIRKYADRELDVMFARGSASLHFLSRSQEPSLGSVAPNRPPSLWPLYKGYVWVSAAVLLAQGLAIFALVWQRARRRNAENELAMTYERLRMTVEAGRFVGWDWDIKAGTNHWFGDLQSMFGIPSDTYSARMGEFGRHVHPDDLPGVMRAIDEARQSRQPYMAEFRIPRVDGTVRWVLARGKFYYASHGEPERMLGLAVDITDRLRAQELARESEGRFRLVANTAPVMIWMSGLDKLCTYFNDRWLEFTGRSMEQELGNGWAQGVHPEDLDRCLEIYKRSFDQREKFRMEYRLRRHDGEYRSILDIGVPRFNHDQSFAGYIGSAVDVTDQKMADAALRDSEERLRLAQQAARIGTFEVNLRTGVNTWTPELEAMYGLPPGSFAGTQTAFENLVHGDDRAGVIEVVEGSLKTGEPTQGEWRVVWPDGSVHWIAGRWQVFMDDSGEPSRMIGVNTDITERKRTEGALLEVSRRLIDAQEQERIRIARELHDDINQRMALLEIDLTELQQRTPDSVADLQVRLEGLRLRISDISMEIQGMAHRLHSSKLEYLGLVSACRGFCKELAERHKVPVEFSADSVPAAIPRDISLTLFRVLQESLQNAIKHSGSQQFEVHLLGIPGEIQLTVRDYGTGFDLAAAVNTQGLGLISMRERLSLVRGTIFIASKPMVGTEIHVRVPIIVVQDGKPLKAGAAGMGRGVE